MAQTWRRPRRSLPRRRIAESTSSPLAILLGLSFFHRRAPLASRLTAAYIFGPGNLSFLVPLVAPRGSRKFGDGRGGGRVTIYRRQRFASGEKDVPRSLGWAR